VRVDSTHLTSAVAARSAPRKALHTYIDMERAYLPSVARWIRVNPELTELNTFIFRGKPLQLGEMKKSKVLFILLPNLVLSFPKL
jgi:hypothetical protein